MSMDEYVRQTEAREELLYVAAELVAQTDRNAMRDGTPGSGIMVNLDLLRQLANTIERARPGLVDRFRSP